MTTAASLPLPDSSTRFHRLLPRPSTAQIFPFDTQHRPDDPDYADPDSLDQLIRFDDEDDDGDFDAGDSESSGTGPSRTRPGRGGRPQTGSPALTGSRNILSDDVIVDGRPRVVAAPPPVRTTSGGRGHQRHVVSVTSSSTSGSSSVDSLPVVTSFLACALAAAACFHRSDDVDSLLAIITFIIF